MWDRVRVTVPPVGQPVALADLKMALRVDHDDEDVELARLIGAAVAQIDGPDGIGVAMMAQTWRLVLDGWPASGVIDLPGWPVGAVTEIAYDPADGSAAVLDPGAYRVVSGMDPVLVERVAGQAWPVLRSGSGSVRVTYTLGAALAADVPADLVQAVMHIAGHYYRHREAVVTGTIANVLPMSAASILARYRRGIAGG